MCTEYTHRHFTIQHKITFSINFGLLQKHTKNPNLKTDWKKCVELQTYNT